MCGNDDFGGLESSIDILSSEAIQSARVIDQSFCRILPCGAIVYRSAGELVDDGS